MRAVNGDAKIGLIGNVDVLQSRLKNQICTVQENNEALYIFCIIKSVDDIPDIIPEHTIICCISSNNEEMQNIIRKIGSIEPTNKLQIMAKFMVTPIHNFFDVDSCIDFIMGLYEMSNGYLTYEVDPSEIISEFDARNKPQMLISSLDIYDSKLNESEGSIVYYYFDSDSSIMDMNLAMNNIENMLENKNRLILFVGDGNKRKVFKKCLCLLSIKED